MDGASRACDPIRAPALANPFFYMIDGFRYGFVGRADGPVWLGVVLLAATYRMLRTGYKPKA